MASRTLFSCFVLALVLAACSQAASDPATETTVTEDAAAEPTMTSTTAPPTTTTTEAAPTTEPGLANSPLPIGDENFDEIYRLLDAVRTEAFQSNDLTLLKSAVDIGADTMAMQARIDANERPAPAADYRIDEVQTWFQPAENFAVVWVTDTRTGPFEYLDDAGEIVRTEPGRPEPTKYFLVTMRRDLDGYWKIVDDLAVSNGFLMTDEEIAAGPIETVVVGDETVSLWNRADELCFVYPDPVAIFCVDRSEIDAWKATSEVKVKWFYFPSDRADVLLVAVSTAEVEVLTNTQTLEDATTSDGILIAVDPMALPDDEIGILGATRVINKVGRAGDG